jgi:very-short-patch-repair endonuclease
MGKYNWEEIQKFYENGNSLRDIIKEFNCNWGAITKAKKNGLLKTRNKKESGELSQKKTPTKHSEETKEKISKSIKNFYNENPDKFYWRNKNKHISKPCELFKEKLREKNISFLEEYKVLDDRLFSADIAFPKNKIIIEINGNQHYDREGKLKPYYQERHDLIEKSGWKVYEYHYSICYKDEIISEIIDKIKINHNLDNIDYSFYLKEKEINKCLDCGVEINKYSSRCITCSNKINGKNQRLFDPSKEELDKLINKNKISLIEIGKMFMVSDNAVKKRAIKLGIYKGRQKNFNS